MSSAGSFGLLRCSISASVHGTGGCRGRTTRRRVRLATATSGTIDMPRLDSTAVLSASMVPRYMGARGRGICPDSQRMVSVWTAPRVFSVSSDCRAT
jgi:hypothetical protein